MTGGLFRYSVMQSLGAFRYQFKDCQLSKGIGRFRKGDTVPLIKIFYDDGIIEFFPASGMPMTFRFELRITDRVRA